VACLTFDEKMIGKRKNIELKLMAELMKDSRRSDRELAHIIGTSQPTVSRTIERLRKEGKIKEYAMIPDFTKLGFELMSVNFVKYKPATPASDIVEMRKTAHQLEREKGLPYLLIMKGIGMGYDSVFIMFHENYASYSRLRTMMMGASRGDVEKFESFIIDLNDKGHYQPLTLSALAGYLLLEDKQKSTTRAEE
jgi:DNA-binding Lrp family transcriptional regulator